MGIISSKTIPGGHPEWLLNKNFFTDGFHFDRFADYVTTDSEGRKVVLSGTPVPTNGEGCLGLALDTYPLEGDDFNGAIVYTGLVKEDMLPVALDPNAKTALKARGVNFK